MRVAHGLRLSQAQPFLEKRWQALHPLKLALRVSQSHSRRVSECISFPFSLCRQRKGRGVTAKAIIKTKTIKGASSPLLNQHKNYNKHKKGARGEAPKSPERSAYNLPDKNGSACRRQRNVPLVNEPFNLYPWKIGKRGKRGEGKGSLRGKP